MTVFFQLRSKYFCHALQGRSWCSSWWPHHLAIVWVLKSAYLNESLCLVLIRQSPHHLAFLHPIWHHLQYVIAPLTVVVLSHYLSEHLLCFRLVGCNNTWSTHEKWFFTFVISMIPLVRFLLTFRHWKCFTSTMIWALNDSRNSLCRKSLFQHFVIYRLAFCNILLIPC